VSALVAPRRAMQPVTLRWSAVSVLIVLAVGIPGLLLSDFQRGLAAEAVILGVLVLSLVVLTGFVGQISFCQFSFAAVGAFTVGCLVAGHHWSFWLAMPVGVLGAALVGVLVGIPALRLSGLFLAILTTLVALLFDRFILVTSPFNVWTGGLNPWRPGRPTFLGLHLERSYTFYLFVLGFFLLATLVVWNLRTAKTGRVLRAIRDSEIAASTAGLDLTAWKLAAFALSAGLAGLAGALQAVYINSVSAASYDFTHSLQIAAVATVWGFGAVASAGFGGAFQVYGPEFLHTYTPLSSQWFPAILGVLLIVQLISTPDGIVVDVERRATRLLAHRDGAPPSGPPGGQPPPEVASSPPAPEPVGVG
jgi:ABC-type branched-subunit amino acid transport system permease subunit